MKLGFDIHRVGFEFHRDDILQLGIKLWWEEASLMFLLPCLFIAIHWRRKGIMGDE